MKTGRTATAAIVLLLIAWTAEAQEPPGFQVTPFAGYRMGGQIDAQDTDISIELDDSASFGLLVNWPAKNNTEWELHYSNQQTEARIEDAATASEARVDFDAHAFQIGGTYLFEGSDNVLPYLAMTIGGTYISTPGESDTFFSGSLGLGVKFFPSSRVGLRLEARGYATLINSSSRIFCSTAPDVSGCAISVAGDIAGQIETFAGITIQF